MATPLRWTKVSNQTDQIINKWSNGVKDSSIKGIGSSIKFHFETRDGYKEARWVDCQLKWKSVTIDVEAAFSS